MSNHGKAARPIVSVGNGVIAELWQGDEWWPAWRQQESRRDWEEIMGERPITYIHAWTWGFEDGSELHVYMPFYTDGGRR